MLRTLTENFRLISYCRFDDALPLRNTRKNAALPNNPKTVIVCVFPYFVGDFPQRNVSRYAVVNDYHRVAGDILASTAAQLKAAFPTEQFATFVDNSPIREVHAARRAGLGRLGGHGMLIHDVFGSRVFIGEIVTGLEFRKYPAEAGECSGCGRCSKACPTGALIPGQPLIRERCISFISQKKTGLTPWEENALKKSGSVWGCDICADACPHNKNTPKTPIAAFYQDILPVLTRDKLAEHIGKKPYAWRGEAVLLRNLALSE